MIKTSNFEAIKLALKQDKNGYVLTLLIHPDEIPDDVMRDFVGARYQIVAVRLNDDETPMVERPKQRAPEKVASPDAAGQRRHDWAVISAGMMCRRPRFWDWLDHLGEMPQDDFGRTIKNESTAVEVLHRMIGVSSRAELVGDKAEEYRKLLKEFSDWDEDPDKVPF